MKNVFRCDKNIMSSGDSKIISGCIGKSILIGKSIGSGSFGTVNIAKYVDNRGKMINIAIKKIKIKIRNVDHQNIRHIINDIKREVKYSNYVSDAHIGPHLYHSFYTLTDDFFTCYILMELFDKLSLCT
jgi:serine/threonine protein kinase